MVFDTMSRQTSLRGAYSQLLPLFSFQSQIPSAELYPLPLQSFLGAKHSQISRNDILQIEYSRIQIMSKQKRLQKKTEQAPKSEVPHSIAEVFSMTRDVQVLNPYHLDGDIQMYGQQKMKTRQQLKKDADILKELAQIAKLYTWQEQQDIGKVIRQKQYKTKQKMLALILRPEIDREELDFIIDKDWQHDRITTQAKGNEYLTQEKLSQALWQLVDVWTIGATRQEYLSFCRLIKKKLDRAIKTQK